MLISYLLRNDLYLLFRKESEDLLFTRLSDFFCHFEDILTALCLKNGISQIPPLHLEYLSTPFNPSIPFAFSLKRDVFLHKTANHFRLSSNESDELKRLVFNFYFKNFIENEFGHKFIRMIFEFMENKQHNLQKFKQSQTDSLINLTKDTNIPISELLPKILDFINSKLSNYPDFKYLNNIEELINAKKELFPEIFTTGKPKTIAFNEFIHGLYLLITERNSNYMPFIKYVVDELNQINPKYFERNNISVEALRKKVKDQIKQNPISSKA